MTTGSLPLIPNCEITCDERTRSAETSLLINPLMEPSVAILLM